MTKTDQKAPICLARKPPGARVTESKAIAPLEAWTALWLTSLEPWPKIDHIAAFIPETPIAPHSIVIYHRRA